MFRRTGIRVQAFVPLTDLEGERFSLQLWTWWKEEINETQRVLPGARGPWLVETDRYIWLIWIVIDEEQIETLVNFFERTRHRFDLDDLYFDYSEMTFAVSARHEE